MPDKKNNNGFGNLIGFFIIALVIGSVVYSAWESPKPVQEPVVQQEVMQQPQQNASESLMTKWNIGDGKLEEAKSVSSSDLGKAKSISGGGFTVKSGGSSSRSRSASASTPATPTTGGG